MLQIYLFAVQLSPPLNLWLHTNTRPGVSEVNQEEDGACHVSYVAVQVISVIKQYSNSLSIALKYIFLFNDRLTCGRGIGLAGEDTGT